MILLVAAIAIQLLVVVGAPLLLARAVIRRSGVGWASVGAGAATFVASQAVHLPLNALVVPSLPGPAHPAHVIVLSAFLGLSAGVCEEVARYAVMRWARPRDRSGPHALALGAGHAGIEAFLFVGLGALLGLVNLAVIERVGLENLGLGRDQIAIAREQLRAAEESGASAAAISVLERLCSLAFHVSASCLVMRAVVERRASLLAAAIAWHALADGLMVAVLAYAGPIAAEIPVVATVPISLAIIAVSLRALPRHDRAPREPRPAGTGAPIELVRAEKSFGEVRALRGVSLTLASGERCALLGPNGAGKTTAIRLITGALAPSRGHALVFGSTSDEPRFLAQKRRMGIVPQQPGMYSELTVRGYLELVRELYGTARTPDAIAASLGLDEVMERASSALSGGMQRRLSLAAALLPEPDLLVLDEPSAGLDPIAARDMIDCVKEASAGRTTLLCTHNLAEAEELCDSVVILRQGEVALHASIEELRRTVRARIALRARGEPAALLDALRARGHEPTLEDGEAQVPAEDAEGAAPALLRALLEAGIEVYECRIVRPTLEEIFFRVVDSGGEARR